MPDTTCSPYSGLTFEILAGVDCKTFVAHAKVLAKSDKLNAIIKGDWKDSQERKVVLTDWDEDTVSRLLEWLYTDEYTSPDPGVEMIGPAPIPEPMSNSKGDHGPSQVSSDGSEHVPESAESDNTIIVVEPSDEPASMEVTRPVTPLLNLHFPPTTSMSKYSSAETFTAWKQSCQPRKNSLSYEATLFAHAKLYCLADYMLLPDLQALTWRRLQSTLDFIDHFTARTPVVTDLVKVVKYIYANTSRPASGEEPLQKLISTFIALNIGEFDDGRLGDVRAVFDQGGDFAVDVWEKARRNIGALDQKLVGLEDEVGELRREVKVLRKKKRSLLN
ncbi:hypothetical protein P7C71_g2709, partial [Lecanoromycetidae sp. Uapishka_2]